MLHWILGSLTAFEMLHLLFINLELHNTHTYVLLFTFRLGFLFDMCGDHSFKREDLNRLYH